MNGEKMEFLTKTPSTAVFINDNGWILGFVPFDRKGAISRFYGEKMVVWIP